ncbi:hypothetical protein A7981_06185 [Methylovorus sp. MM2]|uniref:hypothetical protein n=1 Tax=Methylovorus sp. MM2 TaxID=1848038 RepID=UPI0007E0AEA6|nr:hypothetical protein [Methylovorus sp. MM2]OAM53015.1 hypothetical protein A7981_06185 [Methylovorus sp. MM2]
MNFPKTDYVNAKRLLTGAPNGFSTSTYANDKRLLKASFEGLEKSSISYEKAESIHSFDTQKAS